MNYKVFGGKEFLSVVDAAEFFGISYKNFKQSIAENKIEIAQYGKWFLIPKETIEKWIKQKEELIEFDNFISYLIEKINSNYPDTHSTSHYFRIYCEGYDFWGVKTYQQLPFMNNSYNRLYFNKSDIPILEEKLTEQFYLFKKDPEEKVEYLLKQDIFLKHKNTKKYIEELFLKMRGIRKGAYVEMINFLRYTMTKELKDYEENEILEYAKFATDKLSKRGTQNFVDLYSYIQKKEGCNLTTKLEFDRYIGSETMDSEPYAMDTFIKIAYMIFNPEYWDKENMLEKATSHDRLAYIWFFHAIHYVCAWRKSDILSKLPRIELTDKPEIILKKIKNKEISEREYKQVAFKVEAYVNLKAEKPEKTKNVQSSGQLHLTIPDSFASTIGMLFMMCEAHARINRTKESFFRYIENDVQMAVNLFGEKYSEILEGKAFSNRKANKTYMRMLQATENESSIKGYMLAAYARSHTAGIDKLPEVTSVYLKSELDHYTVDEITKALSERGTCSFVAYLLCDFLDTEFKKINIHTQTAIMKELPFTSYEIEKVLKEDERLEIKVKETVKEIIKWGKDDDLYEMIRDALEDIAAGKATGKSSNIYCIRKACKKECCEVNRKTCIGCGNEMYVRGFLHELNNEIKEQKEKLENAQTEAEYIKRGALLNERLYPAMIEVLSVIKYTYGQNIDEYKTMFLDDSEKENKN